MTDTERGRIAAICEVVGVTEIDDLSDGFHTFKQLYYQRMMLFAVIVKQNKDKAWKSLRHEDGELCFGGGWFIVGIDTPEGSYTYHYEDNYYSLFDCEELERGKHWDGHTEKDVTRLLSLPKAQLSREGTTKDAISRQAAIDALAKIAREKFNMSDEYNHYLAGLMDGELAIKGLPTIQPEVLACGNGELVAKPEPQWIPVSERLPSEEERKEWIDNNLDGIGYLYPCIVTRYSSINPDRTKNNPYVAKHYFDGEDFLNAGEEVCSEYIIAWMPLPQPYQKGATP